MGGWVGACVRACMCVFKESLLTNTTLSPGHKHKVRVATHIVRGFASVYRHRDDVQVNILFL